MEGCLAGSRDEVDDVSALLAQRRCHRQDSLHETAPGRAVRPEAPLAPQDGGTDGSLRGVVRRLHPFDVDEGPKRRGELEDLSTPPGRGLPLATRSLPKEGFHPLSNGSHPSTERPPAQAPLLHLLPPFEHYSGFDQQRRPDPRRLAPLLAEGGEVPQQVRPADLAPPPTVVRNPAVGHEPAPELPEQLPRRLLPSSCMHEE